MEMLGANQSGCACLSLGRIVFYSEFDWLCLGGENVLPSNIPALGWGSSLCCPAGAFLRESQLEGRSWWPNHHKLSCQAEQEHQEPPGAPGSQDSPCLCSPLSLLREFSCNVLYFVIPASFRQRRGGGPAAPGFAGHRNQRGCAEVPGRCWGREYPVPWHTGRCFFLLEFLFQGQLIPSGGWLRLWGCREGPGHRGKAFGTRTSCKLSTNPRSLCLPWV